MFRAPDHSCFQRAVTCFRLPLTFDPKIVICRLVVMSLLMRYWVILPAIHSASFCLMGLKGTQRLRNAAWSEDGPSYLKIILFLIEIYKRNLSAWFAEHLIYSLLRHHSVLRRLACDTYWHLFITQCLGMWLAVSGTRDPFSLYFEASIYDEEGIEHRSAYSYYWFCL